MKFCQFGGSLPFPLTLRLTPLPRFDLVSALRLDGRYTKQTVEYTSHHEQGPRSQRTFIEQVDKFVQAVNDLGNPIQEESQDMLSIPRILLTPLQLH